MEEANPKHTYKYFPGQSAWTWEQQPGYNDRRPASWHGPLNANGFEHEAWGDDHWVPQPMDNVRARDNGWPSQVYASRVGTRWQMEEHATVRVASRQSRLDNFPLTAPGGIAHGPQANKAA